MNTLLPDDDKMTDTRWAETFLSFLELNERCGIQVLAIDGIPMAFTMGYVYKTIDKETALFVYYVYAKNRCIRSMQYLLKEAQKWAMLQGATYVTAESRRFTRGSVNWFEKKMGFRKLSLVYRKDF